MRPPYVISGVDAVGARLNAVIGCIEIRSPSLKGHQPLRLLRRTIGTEICRRHFFMNRPKILF
jgi:hypothetical protein